MLDSEGESGFLIAIFYVFGSLVTVVEGHATAAERLSDGTEQTDHHSVLLGSLLKSFSVVSQGRHGTLLHFILHLLGVRLELAHVVESHQAVLAANGNDLEDTDFCRHFLECVHVSRNLLVDVVAPLVNVLIHRDNRFYLGSRSVADITEAENVSINFFTFVL
jgi:hypothetical protein